MRVNSLLKIMGVVQRLNQFIEIKGISKYRFYQQTGLSNGALDKGDNLGSDKCEKIYYAFPEINLVWLLTGQGEMLKSNETVANNQSIKGNSNNMIGENGSISVDDKDSKAFNAILAEYNERLKKQEEYIQSLLEEQKSLHQQISKLIDKLK